MKYRVWDIENRKYKENTLMIQSGVLTNTGFSYLEPNNYIIEVCSNIPDNNGKLIYEGDIIRWRKTNESHIGWEAEYIDGAIKFVYGSMRIHGCQILSILESKNYEIVGNIHENEEEPINYDELFKKILKIAILVPGARIAVIDLYKDKVVKYIREIKLEFTNGEKISFPNKSSIFFFSSKTTENGFRGYRLDYLFAPKSAKDLVKKVGYGVFYDNPKLHNLIQLKIISHNELGEQIQYF